METLADGRVEIRHNVAATQRDGTASLCGAASAKFRTPADSEFLEFVKHLPKSDGLLPRWSRWWGDGAIERLIGEAEVFERFEADLPRLPPSWFDDMLEVPPWRHLPAGYLQTSQRFSTSTREAQERHWPVRVLEGTHLHPVVDPEETAEALLKIVALLSRSLCANVQPNGCKCYPARRGRRPHLPGAR